MYNHKQAKQWLAKGVKLTSPSRKYKVVRGRADKRKIVAADPIAAMEVGFAKSTSFREVKNEVDRSEYFWSVIRKVWNDYLDKHDSTIENDTVRFGRDTVVQRIKDL